jgi:multidrug efflux pump
VTVIALVLSWIVSVYFVPYLGTLLLKVKPHDPEAPPPRAVRHAVLQRLSPAVNWCVEHRWMTIGATVLIFALGIVGMGKVQQQFFPDSSRPEILVDIWFPEGTSFAANEEVAKRVEQRLMKEPGVKTVSTWVGSGVPRFYLPLDQVFPQTNVSQLIVLAKDLKVRERLRMQAARAAGQEFPRCAAASSCCPTGRRCRTRCSSA